MYGPHPRTRDSSAHGPRSIPCLDVPPWRVTAARPSTFLRHCNLAGAVLLLSSYCNPFTMKWGRMYEPDHPEGTFGSPASNLSQSTPCTYTCNHIFFPLPKLPTPSPPNNKSTVHNITKQFNFPSTQRCQESYQVNHQWVNDTPCPKSSHQRHRVHYQRCSIAMNMVSFNDLPKTPQQRGNMHAQSPNQPGLRCPDSTTTLWLPILITWSKPHFRAIPLWATVSIGNQHYYHALICNLDLFWLIANPSVQQPHNIKNIHSIGNLLRTLGKTLLKQSI